MNPHSEPEHSAMVPAPLCAAAGLENPAEAVPEMLAAMATATQCTGASFWRTDPASLLGDAIRMERWGEPVALPEGGGDDPSVLRVPVSSAGESIGILIFEGPWEATNDPRRTQLQSWTRWFCPAAYAARLRERRDVQDRILHQAYRVVDQVSAVEDLREVCRALATGLGDLLQADGHALWVLDSADSDLLLRGDTSGDEGAARLRRTADPELDQVMSGQIRVLGANHAETLDGRAWDFHGEPTGFCVGLPLTMGDRVVGAALFSGCTEEAALRSLVPRQFHTIGARCGSVVETRRMLIERERSLRNFRHLLETSRAVSSVLELRQVPELVARAALELSEADQSVLFLLQGDQETLRAEVCLGPDAEAFQGLTGKLGQGITGSVAVSRRPEIVNHPLSDPRAVMVPGTEDDTGEAILAVPLVCADTLVGVLTLYKLDGSVFRHVDLETLNVFSANAAIAIENAHLFASVHRERTRLTTMLQHMREAVVLGDRDGRLILTNPAASALLGNTEDPLGRPLEDVFADPALAEVRTAANRTRMGEPHEGRHDVRLGDATYRVSVSSIPADDERNGVVVLFHDVSEAKRMERNLMESNKMSAVGQLAAGVAHEFNNLIAGISGYAQLLQMNPEPSMIEKSARVILESTERAQQLTGGLLTFSKRRRGTREPVSLGELVTSTLMLLDRSMETRRIRIERDFDEVPRVPGDAGELQQALLNLLINAQHAVAEDGVIRIEARSSDEWVELAVHDSGPGIPDEILDRIFEPFFTTKGPLGASKVPGVGLGLTTSYNILRDHGGSLHAENRPEGGASFVLRLPRTAAVGTPDPSAVPADERRILVEEADDTVRAEVEKIVQLMGYAPFTLESAEPDDGGAPALAVLDRLPGIGLQSPYQSLRDRYPELPILFVVDRDQAERSPGLSDPWVFLLHRPFRDRDLASLMERLIHRRLHAAS